MNLQAYTQSYLQHMQQLMAVAEELKTTMTFNVIENVRESKESSTYCRLGDVHSIVFDQALCFLLIRCSGVVLVHECNCFIGKVLSMKLFPPQMIYIIQYVYPISVNT